MLLIAFLLPALGGALLFAIRPKSERIRNILSVGFSLAASLCVLVLLIKPDCAREMTLLTLTDSLTLTLRLDGLGKVFSGLVALLWPLSTLYATEYMRGDDKQNAFFGFYLMSYATTLGVAFSGNLLTLYLFYELLTLITLPLVMHGTSARSVYAGRKYAYYSLAGAAMVFIGLALVIRYGNSTDFLPGGVLTPGNEGLLRAGYFICFLGFGVKAAVFPLHGWLPTAAVAPTPVTALLHAVAVVKAGVFGVMRITFYSFGTALLIGSWAQSAAYLLAAVTVVFGSVMALRETHLKRRLAYSTVSNLSYVLLGALAMTGDGLTAGLSHMVFHAMMKLTLFLCAGGIMLYAKKEYIGDMNGLARRMPISYTLFALAAVMMVGIPPFIGFQSKWLLAQSALTMGGWLGIVGAAALIISAILTAIYLFKPVVTAICLPLPAGESREKCEPGIRMLFPICLVTAIMLILSFSSAPLLAFFRQLAGAM